VANAFGAAIDVDLVNVIPHRNGLIWAFRFTHIAIDAAFGNQ
jgi:hypothetical protein